VTVEAVAPPDLARAQALITNVEQVIFGKREAITLAAVGLLARGHLLLEDVPGTGKTTLARALARSVDADFRRIQFTSDMLPSDVLGVSVWSRDAEAFRFQAGPIFANIVLADELNRTTPRTQSALLECMNTGQISLDGVTHTLPDPFLVVATQNPLEFEGTYPLPESQLDRFLLRIQMGYPDRESERLVLESQTEGHPLDALQPVLSTSEVRRLCDIVRRVRVADSIREYVLEIADATRRTSRLLLGVSPRASLGLYRASQALALLEGRDFVVPDDVKRLVLPVLAHRVIPAAVEAGQAATPGAGSEDVLTDLLEAISVPE
jgi:MoxR-like ATPase